jgi:SET domain
MSNEIYEQQLAWARDKGLYLNEKIVRKKVNGLYGMYATAPIEVGELLVTYPIERRIPTTKHIEFPNETALTIKNLVTAAHEYSKGEDSEFYGHFMQLTSLDELKQSASLFFDEAELKALSDMNPLVYKCTMEFNDAIQLQIDIVCHLDPKLDRDIVTMIVLNYSSRAWENSSFLPMFEYFNHSDRDGDVKRTVGGKDTLCAKIQYQPGEQIWISYGPKDMVSHALSFNYFDPSGEHFIHFGTRFTQTVRNQLEFEIGKHCDQKYKLRSWQRDEIMYYKIVEEEALFCETLPTDRLKAYIRDNCFRTAKEFAQGQSEQRSFGIRMKEVLNALLQANHVDDYKPEDIPEKCLRFYHLLTKEKKMVLANLDSLISSGIPVE